MLDVTTEATILTLLGADANVIEELVEFDN